MEDPSADRPSGEVRLALAFAGEEKSVVETLGENDDVGDKEDPPPLLFLAEEATISFLLLGRLLF